MITMKKVGLVFLALIILVTGLFFVYADSSGYHSADFNHNWVIDEIEWLRLNELFNSVDYHCDSNSIDGYGLGVGSHSCAPHDSDYYVESSSSQNWAIELSELLRVVQFYNSEGYRVCEGTEDGFCVVDERFECDFGTVQVETCWDGSVIVVNECGINNLWEPTGVVCPERELELGDEDYCTNDEPCGFGQGDCDSDWDCVPGLYCLQRYTEGAIDDWSSIYDWWVDVCVIDLNAPQSPQSNAPYHFLDSNRNWVIDEIELDYAQDLFDYRFLDLSELLRIIQLFNSDGYHLCEGTEDGFCLGPKPLELGDDDYCSLTNTCSQGQGDCDNNDECASGLECFSNIGIWYGFSWATDVCETYDVYITRPISEWSRAHCNENNLCGEGMGDCDKDADCLGELVCAGNVGEDYGQESWVDVCVVEDLEPECTDGDTQTETCWDDSIIIISNCVEGSWVDTGNECPEPLECNWYYWFDNEIDYCEYSLYCGVFEYEGLRVFDTLEECEVALAESNEPELGDDDYCSLTNTCSQGQGDCDNNDECASGLECFSNIGGWYGFSWATDVCESYDVYITRQIPEWSRAHCNENNLCGEGMGDCDKDADCLGELVCAGNVGEDYGQESWVDVCVVEDLEPECTDGDTQTETCWDDSIIIISNCVEGSWVDTGNECPEEPASRRDDDNEDDDLVYSLILAQADRGASEIVYVGDSITVGHAVKTVDGFLDGGNLALVVLGILSVIVLIAILLLYLFK
ncbi:MAG: hypothetical protein U9Q06_02560 [Nanoarchaeota archaeon]|nr:hypothetical protein [Nanoarchaeota archaeon]